MASTTAGAASATADGKGLNVTCPVDSVWIPSVEVVACVLQAPAYVTLASKVTTVTKVTGPISVAMQRKNNTCSSL